MLDESLVTDILNEINYDGELEVYLAWNDTNRIAYLLAMQRRAKQYKRIIPPTICLKIVGREKLTFVEMAMVYGYTDKTLQDIYETAIKKLRWIMFKNKKFKKEFLEYYFK